eukprot:GSMAST32.ASY1.ANO1.98.1 assembled CDS
MVVTRSQKRRVSFDDRVVSPPPSRERLHKRARRASEALLSSQSRESEKTENEENVSDLENVPVQNGRNVKRKKNTKKLTTSKRTRKPRKASEKKTATAASSKRTRKPRKASEKKTVTKKDLVGSKKGKKPVIGLTKSREDELTAQGYKCIAGTDEAGKGPLAGPVVAAACVVPPGIFFEGVTDSKKMSEEMRIKLFNQLTTDPRIRYGVSIIPHNRIDEINILQASMEAMRLSVQSINDNPRDIPEPTHEYYRKKKLKLKATKTKKVNKKKTKAKFVEHCQVENVIKGDSKVFSIAAASIIAKVTRDKLMKEYHVKWPHYEFEKNKGYPTAFHKAQCFKHGACPIHRLTFAPLKNMSKKQLQYKPKP